MTEKQTLLIFAKDGKDIKCGIEIGGGWKVKDVTHKGEKIAQLYFGCIEEKSLKEGYSSREIEIDKVDVDKFWDEFSALNTEEQIEKDTWEKEVAEKKQKREFREKYEEEFHSLYLKRQQEEYERLFEEFLKTKTSNALETDTK